MSRLTRFDRERVSGSDLVWEKVSLRALDENKRHRLLAIVLLSLIFWAFFEGILGI
jgi:hypothetical protein